MEFLVSYFPLETTAHRDGDLEPKQQVQWAEQWELAEMQMQNLKRECRTKTGSTNCFYSCILTSGCLVQGSLFSRLLNCIPKSSDGHEPWEPATRAYLGSEREKEPGAGCQQILILVGCSWAGQAEEWFPVAHEMSWTSSRKLALLSLAPGICLPSCWEGSDICVKFFIGWDTQTFCKE